MKKNKEVEKKEDAKSKVYEALSALIPDQNKDEVVSAVESFLDEAVANLEAEYDSRLKSAYDTYLSDKQNDEKIAVEGYHQALDTIMGLKDRLEKQQEEFDAHLEEQYEIAYAKILEEQKKNEDLEVELWERYEAQLSEFKNVLIDKVDQFLEENQAELYEKAKAEVINDPAMLEHKVAWDKVLNLAADWLSDENYGNVPNSKLEEVSRKLDEQKHEIKMLEGKCMRLTAEKERLDEHFRRSQNIITENTQKELAKKVKKAEGKGTVYPESTRHREVTILAEEVEVEKPVENTLNESIETLAKWKKLSGIN